MNGDVTAMDINCALASRYRRDGDGYWSEISVTEPNDTVLRLDGVALDEVLYVIEHPEPPKSRADVRTPEFIEPKFDV